VKGLTVDGSVTTTFNLSTGSIEYSNGIMKIIETADARSIKFDIDTSSFQKLISNTNKLPASFITGLSTTTTTTNITNANNITGCNLISNNTIKNLSVLFPTTTTDGVNNIIHKNSYLSLTESADNSNIIIDINSSYLNTTTSLSSLFYTQASTNSILTNSYYSHVSTNSILTNSYYSQVSTDSILSSSYYKQTSTNSILSTSYYNQTSTNSLLSSKQGFISSNSNLTLSNITATTSNIGNSNGRAAALMVKGSSATTYSALSINSNIPGCNKNITLMGGNYGHNAIAAGSVNGTTSIYNLGLIPLITTNTILNTVPADLAHL
jgi:hypothetical protein